MRHGCHLFVGLVIALGSGQVFSGGAYAQSDVTIADGMKVSLEYTLTLPDKSVADSNVGQAPITFVQGAHEIVPGLEKALDGMKAGQKRRIDVAAQDAYGPYNNKLRAVCRQGQASEGCEDWRYLASRGQSIGEGPGSE